MIVYDCEIVKAIPPADINQQMNGIKYCAGWRDFDNMGISVICAYDNVSERYRVFDGKHLSEFQKLVDQADLIIGFNNLAFDNRLCRANGVNIPDEKCFDILVKIWEAAGLGPEYKYPSHSGFSLDACVKANFPGEAKTGHGEQAPIQWQRGEIGAVVDYCLHDVKLTEMLFTEMRINGAIVNPNNGRLLTDNQGIWCFSWHKDY
jgi:hypothetical protein